MCSSHTNENFQGATENGFQLEISPNGNVLEVYLHVADSNPIAISLHHSSKAKYCRQENLTPPLGHTDLQACFHWTLHRLFGLHPSNLLHQTMAFSVYAPKIEESIRTEEINMSAIQVYTVRIILIHEQQAGVKVLDGREFPLQGWLHLSSPRQGWCICFQTKT